MGRPMDLSVDDVQPFPGTTVQVVERGEFPAVQEVIFDVADRAFDFAFCLCPVGPAEAGGEPEVVAEVDERGMKCRGGRGHLPFQDDAAEVVVEDDLRHPAEVREGSRVAFEERLLVL